MSPLSVAIVASYLTDGSITWAGAAYCFFCIGRVYRDGPAGRIGNECPRAAGETAADGDPGRARARGNRRAGGGGAPRAPPGAAPPPRQPDAGRPAGAAAPGRDAAPVVDRRHQEEA